MVQDLSRTVHVELVDVDTSDVPHVGVTNGVLERGQPVLVGLLAHSRGNKERSLCLPGSDGRDPKGRSDSRVDSGRHGRQAVWLVESLNVLGVPVHVLEVPETGRVLVALLAVTPESGDKVERRLGGISGRPVVPEPGDVGAKERKRVDTRSSGLDSTWSEAGGGGDGDGGGGSGRLSRGSG